MPPPLPGIARVDSLRDLGVTLTRRLSASDHIVGDCSQSLYALCVLRHYGLTDVCLHTVFWTVVVAKLLYACTAWSGFVTASDRHRVDAFRSKRCGYCHPTNLWRSVTIGCFTNSVVTLDIHYITFSHHPPRHHNTTTSAVDQHNRQLPARTGHLTDGNFITRFVV